MIYTLKRKVKCLSKFKEFKPLATYETKEKIKNLRNDNAKKIMSKGFQEFLTMHIIHHQNVCIVHVVAKWSCKMIELYNYGGETMHVLTLQFKAKILSKVVTTITYLKARFPHKTSEGTTPEEIWNGRKSSTNHL
jgi:hypothetical protein